MIRYKIVKKEKFEELLKKLDDAIEYFRNLIDERLKEAEPCKKVKNYFAKENSGCPIVEVCWNCEYVHKCEFGSTSNFLRAENTRELHLELRSFWEAVVALNELKKDLLKL